MASIELFSYKNGNSRLHKAHPTLKILLITLTSYSITYGSGYQLIYYLVLILIGFKTTGLKSLFRGLKYILFIILSLLLFQIIINRDLTLCNLFSNLLYAVRISEVILIGTLFTGSTNPADITPGLYNIIRNKKIAENISLTIRLVPTFLISWREIEQSLNSRGLYLRKDPFYIIKNITIPLLVETFKKADTISMAMESRCYNGWMKEETVNKEIDIKLIILVILPHLLQIRRLLPLDYPIVFSG